MGQNTRDISSFFSAEQSSTKKHASMRNVVRDAAAIATSKHLVDGCDHVDAAIAQKQREAVAADKYQNIQEFQQLQQARQNKQEKY